jgi:hypothetical protein
MMPSLQDAVAELYGLVPADFTSARNEKAKQAKAAGDAELSKAIQGLKKPTTGAWLVNTLVREYADEIDQALALGAEMRAAQADMDGAQLRTLDKQRRQLLTGLVTQTRALARDRGHKVTEQNARDIEGTLRAALADETAATAVRSGALLDTFTASGLEPVELDGLVALAGATAPKRKAKPKTQEPVDELAAKRAKELSLAREALDKAQAELKDAEARREDARSEAASADDVQKAAANQVKRLRAELDEAEQAETEAKREATKAAKVLEKVGSTRDSAKRALERAEARVSRLE